MKILILSAIIATSFSATPALANEIFSDNSVSSRLSGVSHEAMEDLQNCLEADMQLASSKAIRACSKAYKASIPNYEIRSEILTRRGLLQLSAGRLEKATRDFKKASTLNDANEIAVLSQGYTALMAKNYDKAASLFTDCTLNASTASLATYGLAMSKELSGDKTGAVEAYQKAAELQPNWSAPRAKIEKVRASY